MKKTFRIFISCLLAVCISGIFTFAFAATNDDFIYLEKFDNYASKSDMDKNVTNYAYGGPKTVFELNTTAANTQGNSGKSLKITTTADDKFGAAVISNMEYLEGFEGATVWVKNVSKYTVGLHYLITYTAWPKKNMPYYVKKDGASTYTKLTTLDKTYYNIEIAPGFSGELRLPFSSFNGPVTAMHPVVIQTAISDEQTYNDTCTIYIDSIGIYGSGSSAPKPTPTKSTDKPVPTKPGDKPAPTTAPDSSTETAGGSSVLDDMEKYADTTALAAAGYTANPYATSTPTTKILLNKDAANSFEGNSVKVTLEDENRNPSLQNTFNLIDDAKGFEFWFSNPNKNPCAIYISFNWGPFLKKSADYYVKDLSKNDKDYVKRTAEDKQYFNMEFAPGFKGFVRIPFANCSALVDSLASTSIQLWSLGDDTPGKGNNYYFDNISLYGLKVQAIPLTDKITTIVVSSNPFAFVPRIKGDKYVINLSAVGYNVNKEAKTSHTYVWTLKNTYKGVTLSPAGVLEIDETAQLGEINVSCQVKYNANGQLDKTLEFKMNLSPGESLLTTTGATMKPPKASSKDYFKS